MFISPTTKNHEPKIGIEVTRFLHAAYPVCNHFQDDGINTQKKTTQKKRTVKLRFPCIAAKNTRTTLTRRRIYFGQTPPPSLLASVMKISRLSGVTLTSKLPGGNLTSRTNAGFCFISYARHTSLTARENCCWSFDRGGKAGVPRLRTREKHQ